MQLLKVRIHKTLGVSGCDPSVAVHECMRAVSVCLACVVCVLDQTLTPRKRPCFPYLTTTEHVSPWPQAVLFMGFGSVRACVYVCM